MGLTSLKLQNFRNFSKVEFKFLEGTSVIIGQNASGKTNILEAIYALSTGKSFKAKIEEDMIAYDEELARINGVVEGAQNLEIILTRGQIKRGEMVEKTARKKVLVNGVARRVADFAGNFKSVLFRPQDMDLVTESPSIRRKALDAVLSQADREYYRALLSYEKGLRRRNRLLLNIRDEGASRSHLYFWDKLLIKNGQYITRARADLIAFINKTEIPGDYKYTLVYDSSVISEARLAQYTREEVAAGTTLVGPHRDDLVFEKDGRNLASFGSRGEQRMGVLWVKIAELAFIKQVTNEKPTLLLDDIFSELDHEHRSLVAEITKGQQTILTTADPHYVELKTGFDKIEL